MYQPAARDSETAASRIGAAHLFVRLSVAKMQKIAIFSKTKQFRAIIITINVIHEVQNKYKYKRKAKRKAKKI